MEGPAAWITVCGIPLVLFVAGLATRLWCRRGSWVPVLLQEAALTSAVFLVWQIPTRMAAGNLAAATGRALSVHRWEQAAGLPEEATWQQAVLPFPWLLRAADWYYAVMHFGAMAAVLVWLFARHRAAYRRVRTGVVLVTVVSLLVQLVSVAPPRLVPQLGMVDTASRYGPSVYHNEAGSVVADELSAVPSVHVAWALLVCLAVIRVARHPARWLALAHPVLTVVIVVVTANHFWFDALTAGAVVVLCAGAQRAWGRLMDARARPVPVAVPASLPGRRERAGATGRHRPTAAPPALASAPGGPADPGHGPQPLSGAGDDHGPAENGRLPMAHPGGPRERNPADAGAEPGVSGAPADAPAHQRSRR
ncbi:phosphatase PAP2 family protein [Streptomyces sediminimaris]|uniref:phosphatase PAP2 family protein n=1 Tax=Streptomyces sediminimaris TaxID=3383721 RepID=UPI00399A4590